jgi:hypothetical protein
MELDIRDPVWERPDSYRSWEQAALGYIRDERDLIFVRVILRMTFLVLPVCLGMYLLPPRYVAYAALPYLGYIFLGYGARYGLMLHATGHRPLFKREYQWMWQYLPWVLGPWLGHTPTSFSAHHMWMHHAENNMLGDHSTTLPYKRDSFLQFVHYWARFFFMGLIHTPRYLALRGRGKIAWRLMLGELAWIGMVAVAFYVNWAAALLTLVVPWFMMRWLMMAGNFAQHAFVDVNAGYNEKAYNDGYHIVHHERPALHWSEMPGWFEDHLDKMIARDAVVFDGLTDNQAVWFLLMTKNYDKLARHLVDFKGRTHEEKIAFLKSRVQRTRGELPSLFGLETLEDVTRTARKTRQSVAEALNLGMGSEEEVAPQS